MRTVIQRVTNAKLHINNIPSGEINKGFVILIGIENDDQENDIQWLVSKICGLRVFNDDQQLMNLALKDIQGEVMIVSQFTLFASTKKGNRPSFIRSAKPDSAKTLYLKFIEKFGKEFENKIVTGEFGADMQIALINDGPVTIIIDTKSKE